MRNKKDYLPIGKIGPSFGVRGWLKIYPFTEFAENLLQFDPWYLQTNEQTWTPLEVEHKELRGAFVYAKFAQIDSPEAAKLIKGKLLGITRDQLPPLKKNEFYWDDLIGLTVVNKEGQVLGKVISLLATGSNDVLIVKAEKEHAIPYLFGETILAVDLDKQEIRVDWEPL